MPICSGSSNQLWAVADCPDGRDDIDGGGGIVGTGSDCWFTVFSLHSMPLLKERVKTRERCSLPKDQCAA